MAKRIAIGTWAYAIGPYEDKPVPFPEVVEKLREEGRLEEAVTHYSKALRFRPNFPEAHNSLGVILARQGRVEEGLGHFSEALRLKPNYEEARQNLQHVSRLTGKSDGTPGTERAFEIDSAQIRRP